MQGAFLRFYVREDHRHHGQLAWEWLLEHGSSLGLQGGCAVKSMAGFGHRHVFHDAGFSELTGTRIIEVQFVTAQAGARKLLDLLHREKLRLFYAYIPASFGVVNPDDADPPAAADGS
jgi:PII-like signaling protein